MVFKKMTGIGKEVMYHKAPARVLLVATTLVALQSLLVEGFALCPNTIRRSVALQASAVAVDKTKDDVDGMAHRVAPKRTISKQKRLASMREMVRQRGSRSLDDDHIVEFLSRELLDRSSLHDQEYRNARDEARRDELISDMLWYSTNPDAALDHGNTSENTHIEKDMGPPGKVGLEYARPFRQYDGKSVDKDKRHNKRNKRKSTMHDRKVGRSGQLSFQHYSQTELLTTGEEYALGMKIRFMMKCNEVYTGLSIHLMRSPSLVEWATACGFKTPDPHFVESETDQQIRPLRSNALFQEGKVGDTISTKSKQRRPMKKTTKTLPIELGDFYDDTSERFQNAASQKVSPSKSRKAKDAPVPMNRGTPRDFVEMLLDAKDAKRRMIQCNMRLVATIARKHGREGMSVQDLIQEGSIGLATAAEKFDPTRGVKFCTYATWWIRQVIFRSIGYQSRTIRLPMHIHDLLIQIRKARMVLQQDLGRAPTNEEVAEQLDMTVAKYNELVRLTQRSISIETPKYQETASEPNFDRGSLLLSETAESDEMKPEQLLDLDLAHEDIQKILEMSVR